MSNQTIGEFLYGIRKKNGMTQEYVAERLGVSSKSVSAWENDRSYPDILTLPRIAELYGISVDELVHAEIAKKGEHTNEHIPGTTVIDDLQIRKGRYALYVEKRHSYSIFALFSALISILGCCLTCFVSLWALFIAVGGCFGWVVLMLIISSLEHRYLRSEGIYVPEDINDENKNMVLACRFRTKWSLIMVAAPYFLFGFPLLAVYMICGPTVYGDNTALVLIIAAICTLFGSAGIGYVPISRTVLIKKYGEESHRKGARRNARLTLTLLCSVAASMLIFEALAGIHCLKYGNYCKTKCYGTVYTSPTDFYSRSDIGVIPDTDKTKTAFLREMKVTEGIGRIPSGENAGKYGVYAVYEFNDFFNTANFFRGILLAVETLASIILFIVFYTNQIFTYELSRNFDIKVIL